MLSHDQVRRRMSKLSGVVTWQHDMCVDSRVGSTGPCATLVHYLHPRCGKPRYDPVQLERSGGKINVPQKAFATPPIGPQLQSRWKSPDMARKMHHRRDKATDLLQEHAEGRTPDVCDDILSGYAYLDAVQDGRIKERDAVLILLMDGTQLLRNRTSDCRIYGLILLDLRSIIPGV